MATLLSLFGRNNSRTGQQLQQQQQHVISDKISAPTGGLHVMAQRSSVWHSSLDKPQGGSFSLSFNYCCCCCCCVSCSKERRERKRQNPSSTQINRTPVKKATDTKSLERKKKKGCPFLSRAKPRTTTTATKSLTEQNRTEQSISISQDFSSC